jgi:hypothetical protein
MGPEIGHDHTLIQAVVDGGLQEQLGHIGRGGRLLLMVGHYSSGSLQKLAKGLRDPDGKSLVLI